MTTQSSFWKIVNKLQTVLLLNDDAMANLFDMPRAYFKNLKIEKKFPEQRKLAHFASRLNLCTEAFFTGEIDYIQVQNSFLGNYEELPTKYSYGGLSKTRTIINCLNYIEDKYGLGAKHSLLRSLQIDPRYFDSPERKINIYVLTDICSFLRKHSFSNEDFIEIGKRSYDTNKNTELGCMFSTHKNVYDLFEDICSNLSVRFDQNFNYSISKVGNRAIHIQSAPTQQAQDLLKTKKIGNETICLTKLGVFGTFPNYLGLENGNAVKTKCLYQGDSCNEYKVTF
jgi:hypothetical protein